MTPILQILITIIGSGALFSFIQFLITRHDTNVEKEEHNEIDLLRAELKQHLIDTNQTWKETYCDKNFKAIEGLQEEVREGLEEREAKGLARYQEHRETIDELKKAVLQLVQNDTDMKEYMETIGESLVGLSHDKIISLSNKYSERGGVTLKEKATIQSIYKPYKKLGGNGDCEVAYEYINNLPVISDEKAKELDKELEIEEFYAGKALLDK